MYKVKSAHSHKGICKQKITIYSKMIVGNEETSVVPCPKFNGIKGIELVLLEKAKKGY